MIRVAVSRWAGAVGVFALMAAAPGVASAQPFGYGGGTWLPGDSQSYCGVGQPCTYVSTDSSQWTAPAGGTIGSFTVSHGAAPGPQAVALLLVRYDGASWSVVGESQPSAESGGGQLSASAGTDTFTLQTPLQVRQGDALAVTVLPDANDAAANVLVSESGAGGSSLGCASAPQAGQGVGGCGGTIAEYDTVIAVNADLASAGGGSTGGSASSGGSSSGGSTTGGFPAGGSGTITPFQAAEIAFYRATIIKPLPPVPPLKKLPAAGWAITVPAVCDALCVYAGTLIAENIGVWYSDARDASASRVARSLVLGTFRVTGRGGLRAKLRIFPKYRHKLLRSRQPVLTVVQEKVTDRRYGFVKTKRQILVLWPS